MSYGMTIDIPIEEYSKHKGAGKYKLELFMRRGSNKSQDVLVLSLLYDGVYNEVEELSITVGLSDIVRAVKTLARNCFVLTKDECD